LYLDELTFSVRETDVDDYDSTPDTQRLGLNASVLSALFAEELGAVLQIRRSDRLTVMAAFRDAGLGAFAHVVGHPNTADELRVVRTAKPLFVASRASLQMAWSKTSHMIQAMRDNPATSGEEFAD
jgi:phosphoribosylformylglycinamidine synthase